MICSRTMHWSVFVSLLCTATARNTVKLSTNNIAVTPCTLYTSKTESLRTTSMTPIPDSFVSAMNQSISSTLTYNPFYVTRSQSWNKTYSLHSSAYNYSRSSGWDNGTRAPTAHAPSSSHVLSSDGLPSHKSYSWFEMVIYLLVLA